jgi:hypothetical protein
MLYVVIGLRLQFSDLRFSSRVLSKSKKVGQVWQPNSSYRISNAHIRTTR